MKKSSFWTIIAIVAIVFAVHSACTLQILSSMICITTCCTSLVIGAWYERKEKEQEENH